MLSPRRVLAALELLAAAALFPGSRGFPVAGWCSGLPCLFSRCDSILMLCLKGGFSGGAAVWLGGLRCRVSFLRGFCRLLLFLFFLWCFLDAGKLAQKFFPLLGSLAASRQLRRKNLFHDVVELRAPRHPQSFQFIRDPR